MPLRERWFWEKFYTFPGLTNYEYSWASVVKSLGVPSWGVFNCGLYEDN
jgi:hypothetical protein